ncbi:hypothetical protein [Leptospira wolffii]|uniref:hypothetical protein n=1 Tax=Leptospira wolffii TaxID=409998 RepID=UPI000353D626|nr:hypothetical protein [Leptospira wolffii]EPG66193.1 putative toxin-antitoxin system, antitoxin component, ribbon-helix-helix domain protein [Leptospira wolffii serovar Khorat str. Khorat-H2]
MIRTQIQLPDELYDKAKRLAEAKEISLAELTRRGLEYLIHSYPEATSVHRDWEIPESKPLGWKGLSHEEIRNEALRQEEAAIV